MPDAVGLDADLVLAIDRALSDVDRLEAALAAATTGIPVSLDVSGVDQQLADAITAGSATPVVVAADTAEIPTSIEDAVAAITPDVVVGADTGDAETSIAGLADAPPVDVPVSADTTDAETTIAGLADQPPVDVPVDADTDPATAAIASLSTSVPPIVVEVDADLTAATEQVSNLGAASSSSESAVSGLEGSVTGLGVAAGITEGSAKELLSTLGEMGGEGSGAVAAAGAVGTLAVVTGGFFTEGMQAVSAGQRFNMLLGDMAEKIDHIDLNGLNTSVKDLGLSFGSTESEMENVNARLYQNAINAGVSKDKAVEFAQQIDTLAARAIALNPQLGTLDEVAGSLGDKLARGGRFAQNFQIQLTAGEIATRALADTGKTAAADLTVVEKSIAGAELASEKYGGTLAGTVAEGQKNAAVQASEMKARFKEAIEQIGVPIVAPVLDIIREAEPDAILIAEALGRLAKDALPAVAAALDVIGPPLHAIAWVLDQLPDGVIAGTVAFFGFRAAMEAVAVAATADEVALTALSTAIPWLAAVGAAVVLFTSILGDSGPYVDDVTKKIDAAATGFDDLTVSVRETVKAEVEAAAENKDFAKLLNDANVSTDQLTDALIAGGDVWDKYAAGIVAATGPANIWNLEGQRAAEELQHLRDAVNDAAEATLQKAVADGKITQADLDAAVANAGLVDGHKNYAKALDEVQPKIKAVDDATAAKAETDKRAKDAADEHAAALERINTANQAVAMTMVAVQQSTGDQTDELEGLAVALNNANLEGKDFDAVAQELGVTSDQLKGFIGDVKNEIDGFVNSAMQGLPDVSKAIDDVLNPTKEKPKAIIIDPDQLQQEIDDDIAKINAFNLQLAYLTEHGLNNLAQIAAQKGPEFTSALVTKLQDGGDEMGRTLDSKFGELNTLVRNEPDHLREAGTGIALATGDIGADASKAFGDKFQLGPPTDAATSAADAEIDGWAHTVPGNTEAAGTAAVGGWAHVFQLVPSTSTAMSDASGEIDGWAHGLRTAGETAGGAAHAGVAAGVAPIPEEARSAMSAAGSALIGATAVLRVIAYGEGFVIGQDLGHGLEAGIRSDVASIARAASDAVTTAEQAARDAAQSHSPSQLFAAVGEDMATGLAQGIDDGSDAAAIAAASLATKAAASAEEAALSAFAKSVTEVQDNAFALGLTSADEYLAQLRERLVMFVPLSNEWTQVVETMQRVQADEARQAADTAKKQADAAKKQADDAAKAVKDAADAAKKQADAAAAIAADHQRIHDIQFQVGDLDASAYLDMLNQRMRLEEEAGRKYSAAWKSAYDTAQRVKSDLDKANLDKPFQDLADSLDVSVDKLHEFKDKLDAAIDNVAQKAESSLPTISGILSKSLDASGVLDPKTFETNIDDQIKQIQEYTANVDKLMAAGLSHTAQLAIEQGPAAAAALAAAGSRTLEESLGKFDDVTAGVTQKAKYVWGPQLVDQLGETAQIAGRVFSDQFTDTFLESLRGKASTIEDAFAGLISYATGATPIAGAIADAIKTPKIMTVPIMLPAAAPGVPVQSIGAQYASAVRDQYRSLLHIEHLTVDTGGSPVTADNASKLGEAMGSKLADVLAGRLAGIVK